MNVLQRYRPWFAFVCAAVITMTQPMVMRSQEISYRGSIEYSREDYLSQSTMETVYFMNGVTVSIDRLTIAFDIPVIYQSIPSGISSSSIMVSSVRTIRYSGQGGGHMHDQVPDTLRRTETGIGDPTLGVRLGILGGDDSEGKTMVDLSVEVKAPLADTAAGLGTGEWDFGGGISVSSLIGNTMLFADLSYWVLGEPPGYTLINPWSLGLGIGYKIPETDLSLILSAFGSTPIVEETSSLFGVGAGATYSFSRTFSINGSTTVGLTDPALDFTGSIGWRVRF